MFQSFFKIAFRNLVRHKVFSIINILGLAIGISVFAMTGLYLLDELSYDKYHKKHKQIYRVVNVYSKEGIKIEYSSSPFRLASSLKKDYPDIVENVVRFFNFQDPYHFVKYEEKYFNEKKLFYVDSSVFEIFDYDFVYGNKETSLRKPNSIVITQKTANRYFGNDYPIGKILMLKDAFPLEVTGVIKDVPLQSHFKFDILVSFKALKKYYHIDDYASWVWNPCWTYILLKKDIKPEQLESKLSEFVSNHFDDAEKENTSLYLQPLTDIHLNSNLDFEIERNNNNIYIYILLFIAIIIMIIASINFANLTTASSGNRTKEIGLRKVHGASSKKLIIQFLIESVIISLISLFFAIFIVEATLGSFNILVGTNIALSSIFSPIIVFSLIIITIFIGIISGIYPAFYLSRHKIINVLTNKVKQGKKGKHTRKILIFIQFTISSIMIISALVNFRQVKFLNSTNLGFNKENIVLLSVTDTDIETDYDEFKEELLKIKGVQSVTAMYKIIGTEYDRQKFYPIGFPKDTAQFYPEMSVRYDFIKTFGIKIIAGKNFDKSFDSEILDDNNEIIINEAMVKHLNCKTNEEALGKKFKTFNKSSDVIGVIKNFNITSLHKKVSPLVITLNERNEYTSALTNYVAIKINLKKKKYIFKKIEKIWNSYASERPIEYINLTKKLSRQYKNEELLGKIAILYTILIIFITSIGMWGLTSFLTLQRTKEIGIRKAIGASVFNIVKILSIEFVKIILAANFVAWPISYFAMNSWLDNFAYRTDIELWVFILATFIILIFAIIMVAIQTTKAAIKPAINALRYE